MKLRELPYLCQMAFGATRLCKADLQKLVVPLPIQEHAVKAEAELKAAAKAGFNVWSAGRNLERNTQRDANGRTTPKKAFDVLSDILY